MTFKIKLKTGFFKTRYYYLTIGQGQIILTPQQDNEDGRLVINEEDLQSICITRRNLTVSELEIITHSNTHIGSITDQISLEEVSNVFTKEFGHKFIFQHGLF